MAIFRRLFNRCSELVKTGRTLIRHTAASFHSKGFHLKTQNHQKETQTSLAAKSEKARSGGQKKRDPFSALIKRAKKQHQAVSDKKGLEPRYFEYGDKDLKAFNLLRSTGSRIAATTATIVPIVTCKDCDNNKRQKKKPDSSVRNGFRTPSVISMANSTTNANTLIMNEDEIIRRKLLIDGDGVGDDRRINMLVKNFFKWLSADQTAEERRANYERILMLLDNCEHAMQKSHQMLLMNQREMDNYQKLYTKIENGIQEAQNKIAATKRDLLEAKRDRKNKEEYDVLARTIESHPKRQDTLARLSHLEEEMKKLSAVKEDLNEKLTKRRRQLAVLLGAANDLQVVMQEGLDTNGNTGPGKKETTGVTGANITLSLNGNVNDADVMNEDSIDREDGEMDDNEEMEVAEEGQVV